MRILEVEIDEDTFNLVVKLEKAYLRWKQTRDDSIIDAIIPEVEKNPIAVMVHSIRPPSLFTDYRGEHKLEHQLLH